MRRFQTRGHQAEMVEVVGRIWRSTAKAVHFSDGDDESKAVWLPLSQISIEQHKGNAVVTITMEEWLAKDKGFV